MSIPQAGSVPPYFTAAEALSLIAYGDPRVLERPKLPGEPAVWKWGMVTAHPMNVALRRHRLIFDMRWTLARVRWRLRPWRGRGGCPLPPLGRERRAFLRHLWTENGRRPFAAMLHDLCADVAATDEAWRRHRAEMRHASARICGAVLSRQLHPIGRRGRWGAQSLVELEHQAIPASFFAHFRRIVTPDGWATLESDGLPANELRTWREADNPDWGDVRFPTREVMALWERKPPRPPALQELPAEWTAIECVAWIALRDTSVVHRAGLVYDLGAPFSMCGGPPELRMRPDGTVLEAEWPCKPGIPLIWIDVEHIALEAEGRTGTRSGEEAIRALVTALQRGELVATAEWRTTGERRALLPADWRTLTLDSEQGSDGILVVHRTSTDHYPWPDPRWRDVTIPRNEAVRIWPPYSGTSVDRVAVTIAGEARLQAWLEDLMRASPHRSPGKRALRAMAAKEGLISGARSFNRAFTGAVRATGATKWSGAGAKSKR